MAVGGEAKLALHHNELQGKLAFLLLPSAYYCLLLGNFNAIWRSRRLIYLHQIFTKNGASDGALNPIGA